MTTFQNNGRLRMAEVRRRKTNVNIALKEAGVDETSKQEAREPILTFNNLTN